MKLCFSILVTAVGLTAAAAEPDNVETSRKLREDPLNNLRGGWPTPSSVRYYGTPIPTDYHWPGTQIPTQDHWPGTQIPTPTHPSPGTPTGSPLNPTPIPTGSPFNPTPTPSFFPSVSLSPTDTCGPTIENYSKMGKGKCLDGDDALFNFVRFDNIASAIECAEKCNCASQTLTVQGFDYNAQMSQGCRCLVDESSNLSSAVSGCSPDGQNANNGGFGKVINTNTNNSFCCFRNDLTSAAPSVSLAPSTTIKPSTSSAPSNSLVPTLAPSASLPPTDTCGPTIENYSKMGKGKCLDGDDALFNFVRFDNIASATECAEKCNCASQTLTVQGFDYNAQMSQGCRCLVDESSNLSSAVSGCSPDGQNASNGGFGKVINTNTNNSFCCFRNDLTSAAPSVSLAPSTTVKPSTSSAPSNSLVPTLAPSASLPPTDTCGPTIENYSKMGKGKCLDGDDALFNFVRFDNIASATECAEKCNCASQTLTVQGFDYNAQMSQGCRCLVDESSNLSSAVSGCSPDGQNASNGGFGKVINTNTNNSFCCFRNDLTSAAPSASIAPSTSLMPSISLVPSQSSIPTEECGPSIENYSKMGKGKCLDGDGALYNFVRFDDVASSEECAEKCNCASQTLTVQGFDYNAQISEGCRCLVHETSNLNVCGRSGRNIQNVGFGRVTSTNGNPSFCCFRNELTSAAPSVSPAPSASMVPSVSTAPSRELKTGKSCNGDAQCRSGCCREENPGEGKVCIKLNQSNNNTCPNR